MGSNMRGSLVLFVMIAGAWAACATQSAHSALAREQIEQAVKSVETALNARDLDGALSAYASDASALIARTRVSLQGWFSLNDSHVSLRVASLKDDGEQAEAIVFHCGTYTEFGREKADAGWKTLHFRRLPVGWRIDADEDRQYARCLHTDLRVNLAPDEGRMRGTSSLRVEITDAGEDNLLFGLNRGLEITAVTDERGRAVAYERHADVIVIQQEHVLREDEECALTIAFEGTLFNDSKEQGFSQVSLAPRGSFASWVTSWYPHLQGTGSKSKGRITYDVPAGVTVASSGRLAERRSHGEREEQIFAVDRPLDFSFAAANYFHREETVDGIHLGIYLLRGGNDKADLYIKECVRVLRCEQELYGAYPFDGYAVVEIPSEQTGVLGGSSEQGMNLFPVGVLPDDAFPLLLIGHEMGHSWWGNLVSCESALLSEGLAQMTAVLCVRELQGEKAMRGFLQYGVPAYRQSAREYFLRFAADGEKDLPLGRSVMGANAGSSLHDLADTKGVFVYAMLRDEIGHDAFVGGLRSIVTHFARKFVTLADLRTAWEKKSGRDLRPFFEQWFERTGAPELALQYTTDNADRKHITSGTITQSGNPYRLEVELVLVCAGKKHVEKIAVSGASTAFSIRTDTKPELVVLDPEYKILRWTDVLRNVRLLASAESLRGAGKIDEALAKLSEYEAKAPESLEGQYVLGLCHQDAGRLEEAESHFRRVIDRYHTLDVYESAVSLSLLHLGQVLDSTGRRNEASSAYQECLALPDESGSHKEAESGVATPYIPKPRASAPGAETLARFVGNYDNGAGFVVTIALNRDGVLTAQQPGGPVATLEWIEGVRFRVAALIDTSLLFLGDNEVTGMDVTSSGNVIHLSRAL
jgi:ketosteroid isomerase-like protein